VSPFLCQPGVGLVLGPTGRPVADPSAATAVYVRLAAIFDGWWWDATKPAATEAEIVREVSPGSAPRVEARATILLQALITQGLIKDVTATATPNYAKAGYDLVINYTDLVSNTPATLNVFAAIGD